MKIALFFLPVFVAAAIVLQGGLNRGLGLKYGWSAATLMNNAVGLVIAGLVMIATIYWMGKPVEKIQWEWWYFLPGALGVLIVMGVPYSINEIGAAKTVIILVAAQMVFGLCWDRWVQELDLPWTRIAGAVLALAGALLAAL